MGILAIVVLFSCFPVSGTVFGGVEAVGSSGSGTTVGGIIWKDTVWTLENSPYIVVETVQIPENVTLTIEPGVTVVSRSPPDMFLLHGRIEAHGTPANKIVFDGGGVSNFFSPKSSGESSFLNLSYCIIRDGLSLWPATGYSTYGSFSIKYCELINLKDFSYVWYPMRDVYVEYNIFINSAGFSVGSGGRNVYIRYNLFKGNRGFVVENWASYVGKTVVKYNSFIGVSGTVLKLYPGIREAAMIATENYWGTNDTAVIDSMIYDKKDDITCAGFIEYLPILVEPHPDTPTLPLIVKFSYSPSMVSVGKKVAFDGSASFGLYSSIVKYVWDFGDGNVTTTLSPKVVHSYTVSGDYSVTLTVVDEFGFKNSTTANVKVLEVGDSMPPVTVDDYDGLWHTSYFSINLTASDDLSGVAETFYRVNGGPVRSVGADGQPWISDEGFNNTLEYWSVDYAGNEEEHHFLKGIKLDLSPPTGSVAINEGSKYTNSTLVNLILLGYDNLSGVAEVRLSNDERVWSSWRPFSSPMPWTLDAGDGPKTVYVQFKDRAGLVSQTYEASIILDMTKPLADAGPDQTIRVGETIIFDAVASDNFAVVGYEWNLGDGTIVFEKTFTYTYKNPGTYLVTLKVRDAAGNVGLSQKTVTVQAPTTTTLTTTTPPSPTTTSQPTTTTLTTSTTSTGQPESATIWLTGTVIAIALLAIVCAAVVHKGMRKKGV
ncbi:MAG: PKD domain-containing protein [Nitrososphaeria archaeon]